MPPAARATVAIRMGTASRHHTETRAAVSSPMRTAPRSTGGAPGARRARRDESA